MNTWYFWERYKKALDIVPSRAQREGVKTTTGPSSQLDREIELRAISRFLSAIQRMPKAWGSRPWSSHELIRAGNVVANELYRKKKKRELGLR